MVLEEGTLLTFILATGLLTPHVTYHFCDLIGGYIPVYGNYDTSPEKVRMTRFELLGDFLKRFQNPGLIVNRSIKLIRLKHIKKKTWYLYYIFKRGWSWGCERTSKHKPLRDRSWAPDTWRCPGGARRGPCRDTPSAPERVWWARQSRWKLSQTSPTRHLGLGTPHLDPQWPVWGAVSDWKHPKKQTIRVKISHWICDLKSIKKGGWYLTQPVIESCRVSDFGPQGLEQLPVEAVPPREGLAVGEQEADRVVPREADVAVRPVGDVFHQPLDADQRGAVDVEGSACQQKQQDTTSDRWT